MTGASGRSGEKPCPCAIVPLKAGNGGPLLPEARPALRWPNAGGARRLGADERDEGAYRLRWAQSVFLLLFLLSGTRAQGQAARTAA